jgi:membrane associated rhomboid family serine protease
VQPTRDPALERPTIDGPLAPVLPMVVMVAIMWIAEVIDTVADNRLDRFGIRPRRIDGLDGIVFSPFLHGGFGHLIANTVPFVVLGGAICLGSRRQFLQVTAIVAVIGGLGTWLTGASNSIHIGASGLVFGFVLYLVSRGVFARKLTYLLGGVVVLSVYGGVLWGLLPAPGISWQGHLFGAVGGVAAGSLLHGDRGRPGEHGAAPGASARRP